MPTWGANILFATDGVDTRTAFVLTTPDIRASWTPVGCTVVTVEDSSSTLAPIICKKQTQKNWTFYYSFTLMSKNVCVFFKDVSVFHITWRKLMRLMLRGSLNGSPLSVTEGEVLYVYCEFFQIHTLYQAICKNDAYILWRTRDFVACFLCLNKASYSSDSYLILE